ncbi:hypothetical protein Q4575_02265 [Psychrosphaera sp. 1_MG-2023]|uniref:hypothetical protein n=1 Tax=Psychrosphaera sp. 1_MG-2023 TaxID=3062643 RepID=UPI0026E4581C|nr:hypothetical protein [Psychrosphaera sp. 1_MG-2023]MDO6718205.1 hypothetical protein [Psychrosphaera sp. 1_MG-2023]
MSQKKPVQNPFEDLTFEQFVALDERAFIKVRSSIASLLDELTESQTQLQSQLEDVEAEKQEIEDALLSLSQQLTDQESHDEVTFSATEISTDIQTLQKRLAKAEQEAEYYSEQLFAKDLSLSQLTTQIGDLNDQLEELSPKADDDSENRLESLTAQLNLTKEELAERNAELNSLRQSYQQDADKYASLEQQLNSAQTSERDSESDFQSQISQLHSQLSGEQAAKIELQKQYDELQQQCEEKALNIDELQAEVNQSQIDLASLTQQVAQLEIEVAEGAKSHVDDKTAYLSEIRELKDLLDRKEKQRLTFESNLNDDAKQFSQLTSQIDQLKSQLAELEHSKLQQDEELKQLHGDNANLQLERDTNIAGLSALQSEHAKQRNEFEQLKNELANSSQSEIEKSELIQSLELQLSSLSDTKTQLETTISEQAERLEILEARSIELTEIKLQSQHTKSNLDDLSSELRFAKSQHQEDVKKLEDNFSVELEKQLNEQRLLLEQDFQEDKVTSIDKVQAEQNTRYGELESQFNDAQSDIVKLQTEAAAQLEAFESAKKDAEENTNKVKQTYDRQIADLERELQVKESQILELSEQSNTLAAQQSATQGELASRIESEQSKIEQLEQQAKSLAELDEVKSEQGKQLEFLTSEKSELELELSSLQEQLASAESTSALAKSNHESEIKAINSQVDDLQQQITKLTADATELEERRALVQQQLEATTHDLSTKQNEVDALAEKLAEQVAENSQVNAELADLKESHSEQVTSLEAEKAQQLVQLNAVETELELKAQTIDQVTAQVEDLNQTLEVNVAAHKEAQAQITTENAILQHQLHIVEAKRDEFESHIETLESRIVELQNEQTELHQALEQIKDEKREQFSQQQLAHSDLSDELIGVQNQLNKTSKERDLLAQQYESLQKQRDDLSGILDETRDANSDAFQRLTKQNNELQAQLEVTYSDIQQRETEIETLKESLTESENTQSVLAEIISKSDSKYTAMRNEFERAELNFEVEISKVNAALETANVEYQALLTDKAQLENEIQQLSDKNSQLELNLQTEKDQLAETKQTLEQQANLLQSQLDEKIAELNLQIQNFEQLELQSQAKTAEFDAFRLTVEEEKKIHQQVIESWESKLTQEQNRFAEQAKEVARLDTELNARFEFQDQLIAENDQLTLQIDNLQEQAKTFADSALKTEQALRHDIAELKIEIDNSQQADSDQIDHLMRENRRFQQLLKTAETENQEQLDDKERLQSELFKAQQEVARLASSQADSDNSNDEQIIMLQEANVDLSNLVKLANNNDEKQREDIKRLTEELLSAKKLTTELQEQVDLNHSLDEQEVKVLKQAKREAEQRSDELQKDAVKLEQANEAADKKIHMLQAQLSSIQSFSNEQSDQLFQTNIELTEMIEALKGTNSRLKMEHDQLKVRLEDSLGQLSHVDEEFVATQSELTQTKADLTKQQRRSQILMEQLNVANEEEQKAKSKLKELTMQRITLNSEKSAADVEQAREVIKQLRSENNDLQLELTEKVGALETQVTEYRLKFNFAQQQLEALQKPKP